MTLGPALALAAGVGGKDLELLLLPKPAFLCSNSMSPLTPYSSRVQAGAAGAGGMPPGMPNVDPAKYMSAMQRVMGNPQFLEAAESLGKSLLTQV